MTQTNEEREQARQDSLDTRVAITTSIIAVFLAISSIMGSNADNGAIMEQSAANNKWSYFQSKSTKQNLMENHLEILKLDLLRKDAKESPELKAELEKQIGITEKDIERYGKEKKAIMEEAKGHEAAVTEQSVLGDGYDLAEGFYQVSLILAALAALAKKNSLWLFSTGMGGIAILISLLTYLGVPLPF